jgi:tetratricopeptide (TPR) repeat protein
MRKVSSAAGVLAAVVVAGITASGCGQIGALKGKLAFKEANQLFSAQNYPGAVRKYEEAVAQGCNPEGTVCNPPELAYSYFYLGLSNDNQYKPGKDDPKNREYLTKAISYYQQAAEVSPDPVFKKRALQYMVGVYGQDKLNEPSSAEPIVNKLIEMDPSDTANYFQMAKLYEDAGDFEQAEAQFLKAREMKPNDPDVYLHLAGFYDKRGQFDKQMEALMTRAQKMPENPEAQHLIGSTYWFKACLPSRPQCEATAPTSNAVKAKYIQAGLEAEETALKLRSDYLEALIYKGLLLRSQAFLEPKRQAELLAEAQRLSAQVEEIRKRQSAQAQQAAKKTEEE